MPAAIGTKVLDNAALFELPITTLLVGENGETYRIGERYGETYRYRSLQERRRR